VPAYAAWNTITIYGFCGPDRALEKPFRNQQMDAIFFPLPMDHLKSRIEFVEFTHAVEIDGATVTTKFVNHSGIASAFRIDVDGKSVAYMTDHEPYCSVFGDTAENLRAEAGIDRVRAGRGYLHSRAAIYRRRIQPAQRLGTRTFGHALVARDAGVARLVIYHHDPHARRRIALTGSTQNAARKRQP